VLDDVLAIPDHLRDALWRVESARLEPVEAAGVLVCGMGGSAIGADLAASALGERCTRPILTVRDYALPVWATPEWLVLCSSYSGETEEALACFKAAGALGARRIAASTGGRLSEQARASGVPVVGLPAALPAPRAAVAYMFAVAAEVAALAGAAPGIRTEIDAAAAQLEGAREGLRRRAAEIASELAGSVPVVYGADLTVSVARRWKTQVNENAKSMAFFSALPEADHNEIAGWPAAAGAGFAAVFLADADQHPRERQRIELTARTIEKSGATVIRVESEGESRTARVLWTLMLGDLVSLELAAAAGVDPVPVEAIEDFKRELRSG
jgi:glucose/mannose-6-phosphate isomerase